VLSEVWGFIKLSFMERTYVKVIQVLSLTLFILSPILGLVAFLVATALLMPSSISSLTMQFRFLFIQKHEADESIKNEVNKIAHQLGVRVKKVLIAEGLCNAYVRFGTLVLGDKLLNQCGPAERGAIISHELVHLKEKHMWFRMGVAAISPLLPLSIWLRIYWPIIMNELTTQLLINIMIGFALLTYLTVVMILPNWYMEIRADQGAVRMVGKACLISALLAIVTKDQFKLASEDHPSISDRIKLILKYNLESSLTSRISASLKRLVRKTA
jgi:Zn-dependent protease with chaperone function